MTDDRDRLAVKVFGVIKGEAVGRFAICIELIIVMAVLGTVLAVKFL